ncbi:MAG: hypothetical protein FWC01_05640, partial [Treponema sp.]|nr:hypothetical protein [Treponema sp.]
VQLCRLAMKTYCVNEDYYQAVDYLNILCDISEKINGFDRLILDYLRGVTEKYQLLLNAFEKHIDREVDDKAAHIFHGDHYKTWIAAKNGAQIYEKLRGIGRKSKELTKKKNLWLNMLLQNKEKMEFTLYSGKK